jgi:hypothetical protein
MKGISFRLQDTANNHQTGQVNLFIQSNCEKGAAGQAL